MDEPAPSQAAPTSLVSRLWARIPGRRRLAREAAWALVGQLVAAIAMLVAIRVLTALTPPWVYGTANLMLGVGALGKNVLLGPLFQALLRFHSSSGDDPQVRTAARRLVSLAGMPLVGLLVAGGALFSLGVSLWGAPDPATPPATMAIAFVLLGLLTATEVPVQFSTTVLSAQRRQRLLAVVSGTAAIIRPTGAILAVLVLGASVLALMLGYVAGAAVVLVLTTALIATGRSAAPPAGTPQVDLPRQMWRYAAPLVPAAVLAWLTHMSGRYLIGAMLDLRSAGIYVATYGLVSFPFLICGQVVELTLRPVYFAAVSAGDRAAAQRIHRAWLGLVVLIVAIGVVLFALLRHHIAALLLADEYRQGAQLMPWIALGYAAAAIQTVFERRCYAHHKTQRVLVVQIVTTITCVVTEFLLIRAYGLVGAAVAVPCYLGLQAALMAIVSQRLGPPASPVATDLTPAAEDPALSDAAAGP